jgi:hypothetical protein
MVSNRTYHKLSSNGLGFVELEPKPADHRQNRIYPVSRFSFPSFQSLDLDLDLSLSQLVLSLRLVGVFIHEVLLHLNKKPQVIHIRVFLEVKRTCGKY